MSLEMLQERWEHGSDFHWAEPEREGDERPEWLDRASKYGSGRDALRDLLDFGRKRFGWKRLWIPSLFCQTVVAAIRGCGLTLGSYHVRAGDDQDALQHCEPGDVVLLLNRFGLGLPESPRPNEGVMIIEDHSHDPLSASVQQSEADYIIVSLRKTLPLPDGAVLWSPRGRPIPPAVTPTDVRSRASGDRFAAMVLKGLYLKGYAVNKATYRMLFGRGEKEIAEGAVSGMTAWAQSLFSMLPVWTWRKKRLQNFMVLSAALEKCPGVSVDKPAIGFEPFMVILHFETCELRDAVRASLIERSIYPAVLWSLEEPEVAVDSWAVGESRRTLALHCDYRYDYDDIMRVAGEVCEAVVRDIK